MADFFIEGGGNPWILWKVENKRLFWMGKEGGVWHDEFAQHPNSYAQVFDWMDNNDRAKVTEDRARQIAKAWGGSL